MSTDHAVLLEQHRTFWTQIMKLKGIKKPVQIMEQGMMTYRTEGEIVQDDGFGLNTMFPNLQSVT